MKYTYIRATVELNSFCSSSYKKKIKKKKL
jgi:hypothetical protein